MIDVVFCLDRNVIRPMIAAMNSVAENAATPEDLRFSIAVPVIKEDAQAIHDAIAAAFPNPKFTWRTGSVEPPDWVEHYVRGRVGKPVDDRVVRQRAMKYARLYLTDIFPDVGKFIYFDCDVIVRDDVAKLWQEAAISDAQPFAAARHIYFGPMYFRKPLTHFRAGLKIRRPFNSGMFVTDARAWAKGPKDRIQAILDWDEAHDFKLFGLQDEPILNLAFTEYFQLSARWNRCGYGNQPWVARLLKKPLEEMSVIHWSGGHNKPWSDTSVAYADEWWAYDKGPVPA